MQVHIEKQSSVAEHCRSFALGDPKDPALQNTCLHEHDKLCRCCKVLEDTLTDLDHAFQDESLNFPCTGTKNDLLYRFTQSKKAVYAWRQHIVRSINQDECRTDFLESMNEEDCLITLDWAMKFLPEKYRESQKDWFGKRGISWHISCLMVKQDATFHTHTLVHVFDHCTQDNNTVLAILQDTLEKLEQLHPEIKDIRTRHDNAGCYHNGNTLAACAELEKVRRIDFSAPQNGKGPCDRKAALIKAHVRRYINEGHSVTTATEFKQAADSHGGIPCCQVFTAQPVHAAANQPKVHVPSMSFYNNFRLSNTGVVMWKAYGVGEGKTIPWDGIKHDVPYSTLSVDSGDKVQQCVAVSGNMSASECQSPVQSALFSCTEEGCTRNFCTFTALQEHLDCGRHTTAQSLSTMDAAKVQFAREVERKTSRVPQMQAEEVPLDSETQSILQQGWALKSSSASARFTVKQKSYLNAKFVEGQRTGHKHDPEAVSQDMRTAKDLDNHHIFEYSDFLSVHQIAGYFSRLASKNKADLDDTVQAVGQQVIDENIAEMSADLAEVLSVKHPVLLGDLDLCKLGQKQKLSSLSLEKLRNVNSEYDLNVPHAHRKAPYVDAISAFLGNCTCQNA